jgi:hypothetical protein
VLYEYEGGESMKSKIKYTNEPMGKLRIMKDFLPPPDKLVLKEENVTAKNIVHHIKK